MAHVPKASYPICPLCYEHIEIETANTNEKGKAVHEECYVAHVISQCKTLISTEHALSILDSRTRRNPPLPFAEVWKAQAQS
jgi:hypothetical protein